MSIHYTQNKKVCDGGCTIERTVDDLYICLENARDNKYEKEARNLIYRIPVHKPTPVFKIGISDINRQVKKELDDRWTNRKTIDYILKEAVGRIFGNIDERYFLLSVKRLLQVRLI
ncbi:MAG TPA: hypothetical protein VI033_03545 [Candidatus Nitrosopolaris sp.]